MIIFSFLLYFKDFKKINAEMILIELINNFK
jgi:hypothetical protein